MDKFKSHHGSVPVFPNGNLVNRFEGSNGFVDPARLAADSQDLGVSSPSSVLSLEGDTSDSGDFPSVFMKYLNDMLMDEDLETRPCMLQECLALQAAEKSLYEVIGQEYPPSNQLCTGFYQNVESPDGNSSGESAIDSSHSYAAADYLVEFNRIYDQGEFSLQTPLIYPQSHNLLTPDSFGVTQFVEQVKSGLGKPVKSLPNGSCEIIDLESKPSEPPDQTTDLVAKAVKNRRQASPDGSRGKKSHQREDSDDQEEGRSNKHSAVYADETESLDMFDKVLLICPGGGINSGLNSLHGSSGNGGSRKGQRHSGGSNGKTTRSKKQGNKDELVDLWTLLTHCAQAVAGGDQRTATEQLRQIRQHSSELGDGDQRLAHYFANALEARLAGTRVPIYTPHLSNGTSAADILKAYKVYVTACPFKRMSNFFANRTIRKLVLSRKAERIHIIDFGILYGFQWPCLIQRLSERPGGAPKLRVTGIELPQTGFRPAERVNETGRRLQKYAERFNVPFEYSVIAKKWETIRLEDLKIDRDELTIVNCLYRMKNLPDETMVVNSPRDTVLKLIKSINPDLFVHGVINGTFNAPFFASRFREALFHFSSLFDMFEATVPREEPQRLMFEKEVYGKDIMNVIACEGSERVERPETYKQWQVRNLRAGFRQLPLDQDILQLVKKAVKSEYHKDFVVDVDGRWMLQGWKGRIIYALSFWKPAEKF